MSDLIIKPSGTSANFKVQNPSGTNKITMDSDGVTTFASNVSLSGTMTAGTLASGVTFPSGHIIQVVQTLKTTVTSKTPDNTSIDFTDISGMTCDITPQTNNKVLIQAYLYLGGASGASYNVRLMRGSTPICISTDAQSSQPAATLSYRATSNAATVPATIIFLDSSPGGDGSTAITYKFQWDGENANATYLNRTAHDNDDYRYGRGASTITLSEVVG